MLLGGFVLTDLGAGHYIELTEYFNPPGYEWHCLRCHHTFILALNIAQQITDGAPITQHALLEPCTANN